MTNLINKIRKAWKTKQMLAIQTALSGFLMAAYGFDIQPVIDNLEQAWLAVMAVIAGLGITGMGDE